MRLVRRGAFLARRFEPRRSCLLGSRSVCEVDFDCCLACKNTSQIREDSATALDPYSVLEAVAQRKLSPARLRDRDARLWYHH